MNGFWADLILALHFAFVLFVIGGLPLILIGAWRGWAWVRAPKFRYLHLAAIVFVAAEALLGLACPLTVWEDALRGGMQERGFIERWVAPLLYYDLPGWVFTIAYVGFAAVVASTFRCIQPRRRKRI